MIPILMVLLGFEAVAERIGRKADKAARLYLWRAVKASQFPPPLQLSPARIAWDAAAVDRWLQSRPLVKYAPAESGAPPSAVTS